MFAQFRFRKRVSISLSSDLKSSHTLNKLIGGTNKAEPQADDGPQDTSLTALLWRLATDLNNNYYQRDFYNAAR